MVRKRIKSGIVILAAIVLALLGSAIARGANMSDAQKTLIRQNCDSAKTTLSQLHVSDTLLRVNMGQAYESLSAKLMSGFNGRVANNGYDNTELSAVFDNYNNQLDTFRTDYITYEEQLSKVTTIDCRAQPNDFYNGVSVARDDRDLVHDDVVHLNDLIDQYSKAIDDLSQQLQSGSGGNNG